MVPLLLIYEFGVRYTFIGSILNGRRILEKVCPTLEIILVRHQHRVACHL